MILEQAVLKIKTGQTEEFEKSFTAAEKIIASMEGYIKHQLLKCIEVPEQYLLLVEWDTLEDHTIGFRQSDEYQDWKKLLHHFYDPFPVVEHYVSIVK